MRRLPFPDASFDVVLSSLAIQNVRGAAGRAEAIDEAARVLRSDGRIVVADIHATRAYAARLIQLGFTGVARRGLGWRFWYGGPWMATSLMTGVKRD
jgi:arsenite methyltransferase